MLAIIIPYYKLQSFEKTLCSLANQTNKNFKVYIGDDVSPDSPISILNSFKNKFDFDYYLFETNLGSVSLVKQWERCIALSKEEEWLMILGDDDYLDDNVVKTFYENEKYFNEKANIVRFASKLFYQETNAFSKLYEHPKWEEVPDSFFRKIELITRSSLSEYVFKRESYNRHKFTDFPLAWYADDMAWFEFSENKPIFSINKAVVYVSISEASISGKDDNFNDKNEAKYLFYKKLIDTYFHLFKKKQKRLVLFDYEIILKQRNKFNVYNRLYVLSKLIEYGLLLGFLKFIGRSLKNKNIKNEYF